MLTILEEINLSALKLLSSQSLEDLSATIVEEGKRLVHAESGAIYLLKKGKISCTYFSFPLAEKINLKRGSEIKKTLKSRATTIIHSDILKKTQPELSQLGIKSVVFIPLSYHTETIGVLVLYSLKDEHFSKKELDVLKLFGSMVSLAITKARLLEETKRALEIRDRFISLASHELRTPLTSLNGYIQLLHAKFKGKNTIEAGWIEELHHEGMRLTNLVKELLDINRIKQGSFAFVLSEVDLEKVVKSAIEHSRVRYPERKIVFKSTNSSVSYAVVGDFQKLLEMTSALLSNAIKFSPPKDEITLSLSGTSRMVQLQLKDRGKGINKKDLSRVFEGFYKTTEGRDKEGMGVGLMLVKHIITLHRGKLSIDSKENKGTTVEVTLPAAKI